MPTPSQRQGSAFGGKGLPPFYAYLGYWQPAKGYQ